jgi:hypothetical protein
MSGISGSFLIMCHSFHCHTDGDLLPLTDENSLDIASVGVVRFFWANFVENTYRSCQRLVSISASVTFYWLPFGRCSIYNEPKF